MCITFNLPTLNLICHNDAHLTSLGKSLWSTSQPSVFLTALNNFSTVHQLSPYVLWCTLKIILWYPALPGEIPEWTSKELFSESALRSIYISCIYLPMKTLRLEGVATHLTTFFLNVCPRRHQFTHGRHEYCHLFFYLENWLVCFLFFLWTWYFYISSSWKPLSFLKIWFKKIHSREERTKIWE